ncbi:MAG: cell division protein FtsQ/DivIB [Longimicrobiales bacterium]|jgi:hypothetical protein
MRRDLKILGLTLALSPVVIWGPRALDAMAALETFRISAPEIEVTGAQYITRTSVIEQMDLGQFASVWGDRETWAERLSTHPLIREADVRRRLPNGLRVTVVERRPVALAPTPTLEPVDAEGFRLPIDPTVHRLDLPIITSERYPEAEADVFPDEVRNLAVELEALTIADEEFVQKVSSIERTADGSLRIHLIEPPVEFLIPDGTPVVRLREAQDALRHAMSQNPGHVPAVIDLRFSGQVVVRRIR